MRLIVLACLLFAVARPSLQFSPSLSGQAMRWAGVCNVVSKAPIHRQGRCTLGKTLGMMTSQAEAGPSVNELTPEQLEKGPGVPTSESEMISMANTAIKRAMEQGKTRQKVRFLLPRDGKLLPTDEDWPGGIMQLYAACSPLTRALLRKLTSAGGGFATCKEQRLDESGVDGVSLWIAQAQAARDDVSAFCQPSGETLDAVRKVCASAGPRLVLLVNPQWRETLDSYDALGKKDGLLGKIGNFLGGTSGTRQQIAELGFEDTFLIEQYVVRGDDCQIVKCFPFTEWYAYTESDDGKSTVLGKQKDRPTYQDISAMLENKGVAMKWARQAGIGKEFK